MDQMVGGYQGTRPYIAPEILGWHQKKQMYRLSGSQDIFSLGATFYAMLSATPLTTRFVAPCGFDEMTPKKQGDAICEFYWAQSLLYENLSGETSNIAGLPAGWAEDPHL